MIWILRFRIIYWSAMHLLNCLDRYQLIEIPVFLTTLEQKILIAIVQEKQTIDILYDIINRQDNSKRSNNIKGKPVSSTMTYVESWLYMNYILKLMILVYNHHKNRQWHHQATNDETSPIYVQSNGSSLNPNNHQREADLCQIIWWQERAYDIEIFYEIEINVLMFQQNKNWFLKRLNILNFTFNNSIFNNLIVIYLGTDFVSRFSVAIQTKI